LTNSSSSVFLPGERIEFVDRFHLVAEQRYPPGAVLVMRREDLDGVAAHPERAAIKIAARALVLQRDEVGDQRRWSSRSPRLIENVIAE
jgi:hypothetical protein